MDLKLAKVIVTGGSTGIGYETAKLLKFKGATVVFCARDKEKVKEVEKELEIFGIQADVSNEADVKNIFDFAISKMGDFNVLINNAGIGFMSSLVDTKIEEFQRIWETNNKKCFYVWTNSCQTFYEEKRRQHY